MEYESDLTSHMEEIVLKIKRVIREIEQNNNQMSKKIKYLINEFYHDFWFTQIIEKELLAKFNYKVGLAFYSSDTMVHYKNSLKFLTNSDDQYTEINIFDSKFDINKKIGNCYYKLGKISLAIIYYNRALEYISESEDSKLQRLQIIFNLSSISSQRGEYSNSVIQLNEILNFIENVPTNKEFINNYLSRIYYNLAINHLHLKDYVKSVEYYNLGLKFGNYSEILRLNIVELIEIIIKEDNKDQEVLSIFLSVIRN